MTHTPSLDPLLTNLKTCPKACIQKIFALKLRTISPKVLMRLNFIANRYKLQFT
jgi:hypothetical protein